MSSESTIKHKFKADSASVHKVHIAALNSQLFEILRVTNQQFVLGLLDIVIILLTPALGMYIKRTKLFEPECLEHAYRPAPCHNLRFSLMIIRNRIAIPRKPASKSSPLVFWKHMGAHSVWNVSQGPI